MCVCVRACVCVCVKNVVFTTLRINVRVGRPKKKDKRPYVFQTQFSFQMNYIFTKGNIPTQIHAFIIVKAGPPPFDLSFWSFLTFLHHGIEEVERHLL